MEVFHLVYVFVDFFGRVKDKAGDVERILKEKDRHGIVLNIVFLSFNLWFCLFIMKHPSFDTHPKDRSHIRSVQENNVADNDQYLRQLLICCNSQYFSFFFPLSNGLYEKLCNAHNRSRFACCMNDFTNILDFILFHLITLIYITRLKQFFELMQTYS